MARRSGNGDEVSKRRQSSVGFTDAHRVMVADLMKRYHIESFTGAILLCVEVTTEVNGMIGGQDIIRKVADK